MDKEMWDYLSQYGHIQSKEMTWVHPWVTYWEIILFDHDKRDKRDSILEHLSDRYPDYKFGKGEAHINNVIYQTIEILRK